MAITKDTEGYGDNFLNYGQRVELHPGLDEWARGNRFGTIVGWATPKGGVTKYRVNIRVREDGAVIYAVKMDKTKTRLRIAATNVRAR